MSNATVGLVTGTYVKYYESGYYDVLVKPNYKDEITKKITTTSTPKSIVGEILIATNDECYLIRPESSYERGKLLDNCEDILEVKE